MKNLKLIYNNEYWKSFKINNDKFIINSIKKIFHSYKYFPNKDDVETIYQEFYIKLIKNDYKIINDYNENKSSIRTWINIIITSIIIDYFRSNNKNKSFIENEIENYYEENYIFDEIKDFLTDREDCIIQMIFKEDKEINEISNILNIKESTIRVIKKNALEKLKKIYKD